MAYLCPRHQIIISDNIQLAQELWTGAMESGYEALSQRNLSNARNFFGSAYEIAIIRIRAKVEPGTQDPAVFGIEHVLDAGNLLLKVLMDLGLFDEAEVCLMTIHNGLLQSGAGEPKACHLRRMRLLKSANEGLGRIADELAINEKLVFSNRTREQCKTEGSMMSVNLH